MGWRGMGGEILFEGKFQVGLGWRGVLTSWSSLRAMPLHGYVSVEMIECSISFCTSWKVARVEPFDFVEFPSRTLAHGISR